MRKRLKGYPLVLLFIIIWNNGFSQNTYDNLIKEYDDVCFCSVGIAHPKRILKLDNNLEILFALKEGKTLNNLDSLNINYSKSQIALLRISNLIDRKDSIYFSKVPIINDNNSIELRKQTKIIAEDLITIFKTEYNSFVKTLENKGLQKNTFTLFFAYVLDDIVWNILEKKEIIEKRQITKNNPFWDGVMWMIENKRDFSCGTNSMGHNDTMISVNWSDISKISISNYNTLYKMLIEYEEKGVISDKNIIETFSKNELFDRSGKLQIPIIEAKNTDEIFTHSIKIAEIIAEYLDEEIDYSKICSDYSIIDKSKAVVILYHEIMWDILNKMEKDGLLEKPIAFENPEQAKQSDLKDLIFIVRN